MNAVAAPTPDQIADLVRANRAIRAPDYRKESDEGVQYADPDRGLQWGADVIPALLDCFRVDSARGDGAPDGWIGFARHWRGATLRIEFELFTAGDESEPVVVVTAIEGLSGKGAVEDENLGTIELPDEVPTRAEWEEREKRYQRARSNDETDGAASLQAFVAELPGWKRDVAGRFDALVEREVPEVRRAVRWHQPFWGVEDRGWFASFSAFTNHVKLTFVCESNLEPRPPSGTGPTRQALDVAEADELDEEQLSSWIRQAAADPGMSW